MSKLLNRTSSPISAWTRPCLLIILMSACAAWPARAQVSSSTNAPTTVTLAGHVPPQVKNGTATLATHYNPDQKLRLVFGLQPPNMQAEEQFLEQLQTKGSPEYHQFLTPDEWNTRFAPSVQSEQAVVDWAQANGLTVTNRYSNRLLVDVEAPAGNIEKALGVTINSYRFNSGTYFSNDRDPQIPASLTSIIHSIGGLNNLQVLRPASKTTKEPVFPDYSPGNVFSTGPTGGADGSIAALKSARAKSAAKGPVSNITNGFYDPTDMFSSEAYDTYGLYNQGHCCNPLGHSGGTPPESSIAIATAGTQDPNDFAGFHTQYPYLAYHYFIIDVDGTPGCCDLEGTMDFEWSTAMSNSFGSYLNTASVFMYDGVNANFSTFTDVYNKILSDGNARVFSTSWGCEETFCIPNSTMDTDHAIFNSMVGQGWTLVAASGDQGATAGCAAYNVADGVQFPASDPNVVGAGGLTLELFSGPVFDYEVGWTGGTFTGACGSNDGGSTGGYSGYYSTPSYQSSLSLPSRGVPDLSLNANVGQNIYFGGTLQGNGGTSIVAPELAGFFANEEAYLDYLSATISGGLCNSHACTPLGNANYYLYWFGEHSGYAPHYPYYDITSGCNSNDITALYSLGYYCPGSGWDPVTGWGSTNMLQLGWAINTYQAGDFGAPAVSFSGPSTFVWYNSDQEVSWTIADTEANGLPVTGVAGFSQAWDFDPGDVFSEATPGSGNSFYSGPQYANGTSGCLDLTGSFCAGGVGQGYHTVNVRTWDNTGVPSGDYTYGPIGYDTIAPFTSASLSGTLMGGLYVNSATATLNASDTGCFSSPQTGSCVRTTVYQIDGGSVTTYTGSFADTKTGTHSLTYHSIDYAGNVEGTETTNFGVTATTSTSLSSSANPSGQGKPVTFTALVTPGASGTPTGKVTFKDGATVLGTTALNSSGKATFATTKLTGGSHSITASFLGSTYFIASVSNTLTQEVEKTSATVLTSSANPSAWGQSVTLTATVSGSGGTPTGTVTFKNGAVILGAVALSGGKATFTTSALTVGTHSITAVYSGDSNFVGSTSAVLSQKVNKAGTSSKVVSSLNPSNFGQTVTFTATVKSATTGTPTGTVKFMNGAVVLGSKPLAGGTAAFSTATLAVGTHSITAVYVGSSDFNTSTSPALSQKVN